MSYKSQVTDDTLTLLWWMLAEGRPALFEMPKADLVFLHDTYPGGEEVACLESCYEERRENEG